MRTFLGRFSVLAILFTERFVLSFVFFCLAWAEVNKVLALLSRHLESRTAIYVGILQHFILLLVGGLTSVLLLFGRKAVVPPQSVRLIFIPLAATFFPLFYFVTRWFPAPLQNSLAPRVLQMPLMVAGLICIIVGPMIALWGIFYLGRSFGVFVTVRKIVLKGPYRWVRHPMYLGWACSYAGLALANFSAAYLIIVGMHIAVIVYRARLEEEQLCENSPEYREYMKRTGFLLPKLPLWTGCSDAVSGTGAPS